MNTSNVAILPANRNDLKIILDLQKECYQTEAALHDEYDIPPLTQDLKSLETEYNNGVLILKAMIDSQIVGSVRGYANNGTCYIGRLIVERTLQNRKIGQSLMYAIESQFDACERYELFTGYKSEKNLYLYNKLGYKKYKRQKVNDKLTLVYLEKTRNN
jgi:predicted N-acetyltransferase YhbS